MNHDDPHTVLFFVDGHEHDDVLGNERLAKRHARAYVKRGFTQVRIIRQATGLLVPFEEREEA